jgi:hypothetical protein
MGEIQLLILERKEKNFQTLPIDGKISPRKILFPNLVLASISLMPNVYGSSI